MASPSAILAPAEIAERLASHRSRPVAIIDIGSNSVRLVAYDGLSRAPTPMYNEKVLCGLGKAIASTGKLGTDAVDRALSALSRFRTITRVLEVKNVRAFAAAAVREAEDGAVCGVLGPVAPPRGVSALRAGGRRWLK